ncbi:putative HNHc nuclease [Lactiplantibacillus paraxiangfangensis]|uniref:putative HNHc nuclease n=1 Tax=Lactiplantibacillus paraxiangfangensis TaxID=3076224 RepID=UPI0030C6D71B
MLQDYSAVVRAEGDLVVIRLSDDHNAKFIKPGDVVELGFEDGRTITAKQRAKCYAIFNEVDDWNGNHDCELTKRQLKNTFLSKNHIATPFSLANCSMTRANDFIEFLIDFCMDMDVPFGSKTLDQIQGQYGWERTCLKYKKCCICGKHADIAHVHAVGIGRDRNHINNVGNRVMPLCRMHHVLQHKVGIKSFMKKFQIKGVEVTPELQRELKIGDWHIDYGEDITLTREDA